MIDRQRLGLSEQGDDATIPAARPATNTTRGRPGRSRARRERDQAAGQRPQGRDEADGRGRVPERHEVQVEVDPPQAERRARHEARDEDQPRVAVEVPEGADHAGAGRPGAAHPPSRPGRRPSPVPAGTMGRRHVVVDGGSVMISSARATDRSRASGASMTALRRRRPAAEDRSCRGRGTARRPSSVRAARAGAPSR